MDCEVPPPPPLKDEETGDSGAILEAVGINHGFNHDDDDGNESCNGYVSYEGKDRVEDHYEEEDDDQKKEKLMAWSAWIAIALRSERAKKGEEVVSPVAGDDEENRLFWETCLASGYP